MEFYSQPEIIYPSTEVNNVSTGENQNSELEETSTDNTGTNRVLPVRSNNPYYTSYLTHKKVTQNKQVSTSPKQRPRKVVKRVRVRGKLKKAIPWTAKLLSNLRSKINLPAVQGHYREQVFKTFEKF